MSEPATDRQIASISFTEDGVLSCWETRNECLRALVARIEQEQDHVVELQKYNYEWHEDSEKHFEKYLTWRMRAETAEAEVSRLRGALEEENNES